MADYEVLSNQQIDNIEKDARSELGNGDAPLTWPVRYAFARAIERATIEAFRAKHLPELNLQRCYDVQRDELMAARVRIAELERLADGFRQRMGGGQQYIDGLLNRIASLEEALKAIRDWPMYRADEISLIVSKALKTTAPQAADETTTAAPAAR